MRQDKKPTNDKCRCLTLDPCGPAQRIYALDADLFTGLRKRRHLRRLVDVLAGRRDPADVQLPADQPVPALDPKASLSAMDDLLSALTQPDDLWRADLHRYYLQPIKHARRLAGHWSPEAVAWTLASFQSLAAGLMQRAGKRVPPTERLDQFTYLSRGRTEYVNNPVLGLDTLRRLRPDLQMITAGAAWDALGDASFRASEALWEFAAFLTEALAPQLTGGRQGPRWALVWVGPPHQQDTPAPAPRQRLLVEDARPRIDLPAGSPGVSPAPPEPLAAPAPPARRAAPQAQPSPLEIMEGLLAALEQHDQAVDLERDIVPKLYALGPDELTQPAVERLARAVHARDPGALPKVAAGILRAPIQNLRAFSAEIARLDPVWFAQHGAQLDEIFFGPADPADWR